MISFQSITTFVFDVDGVFTNGEVLVMENGDMLRTMSTRDGQAVRYALEAGYRVAVITKGASEGVRKRFEYLGVIDIYDKLKDKEGSYLDLLSKYQLTDAEVLYMGDDLPDLNLIKRAGLSACPSDAVKEVRETATYISSFAGGKGCVRDVIEKTMRSQNTWPGF